MRRLADGFGDGGDDFLLVWKAPEFPRCNDLPVDLHLEGSARTLGQRWLDSQLFLDCGRRTGGPGQIASRITVDDGDCTHSSLSVAYIDVDRPAELQHFALRPLEAT